MNVLHFIIVLICCTSDIDGMLPDECIDPYLNDNGLDSNSSNKANSCVFDVLNDMPGKYEPLFLQNNIHGSLTLTIPKVKNQRAVIKLKKGEKITISCPGNGNYIEAIDTIQSDGSCKSGNMLKIEGVNYSFQQLDCRARVNAKFKKTGMKCGRGKGVIVELGHDVPGHFLPVVEVCYNIDESIPYYSRHLLRGTSLGKEPRKIGRPAYASGGGEFFKGFNPKEAYSKKNQLAAIRNKVGKDYAKKYIDFASKKFLDRGQLSPYLDFVLGPHQATTFFYINVAPMWHSINEGTWFKVEETSRSFARKYKIDLEVVTGTEGVLQLQGKKNKKDIMLRGSKFPVPKHFWKILRKPVDRSCIVFISPNDPVRKTIPKSICKDICTQHGWREFSGNSTEGYVYCCEYEDFKKAVPHAASLSCKNVLHVERK